MCCRDANRWPVDLTVMVAVTHDVDINHNTVASDSSIDVDDESVILMMEEMTLKEQT